MVPREPSQVPKFCWFNPFQPRLRTLPPKGIGELGISQASNPRIVELIRKP